MLSHGCSLVWNAEPVEPPNTEVQNCNNQFDDDGDGFVDCADEDCAWVNCVSRQVSHELELCAYGETQHAYGFDSNSLTRLANACRDQEAALAGGNRSVAVLPVWAARHDYPVSTI